MPGTQRAPLSSWPWKVQPTRVVALGGGLGDVVQYGGPAQPQVAAGRRHVIEHLQGVVEIVLMGVRCPLFPPRAAAPSSGKMSCQQPRLKQQLEPVARRGRLDNLVQLDRNALLRHNLNPVLIPNNGVECIGLNIKVELARQSARRASSAAGRRKTSRPAPAGCEWFCWPGPSCPRSGPRVRRNLSGFRLRPSALMVKSRRARSSSRVPASTSGLRLSAR